MKKILSALLVFALLLSFGACGEATDSQTSSESSEESIDENPMSTVALPDVKGRTSEEALRMMSDAGYTNVKTVAAHKEGTKKGEIIAQSKTAGATYRVNDLIILQVSNGLTAAESASTVIEDPILSEREELDVGANADYTPINYDNMKGMWLSQLDLIPVYYDYEKEVQRTEDDYAGKIDLIMKNLKDTGYNTVVVQVHPDCDSMYLSKYYPWSDYLNGNSNRDQNQELLTDGKSTLTARTYGNTSLYDPMPIMIEAAHKYGLSFQAWINPMRAYALDEIEYVNDSYTIKQWYNDPEKSATYLFKTTRRVYLNPAYQEVRDYIVAVASEICRYYDVDGIHMDDYFYPSGDVNYDKAAFEAQDEYISVNEYRKNNINVLVKALYDAVKAENKDMLFGISPAGNIDTNMKSLSADVKTWCSTAGYIDYICPQIYFGFEHSTVPFDGLSERWIAMNTEESVKMVLGMALQKIGRHDTYAGAGAFEWEENSDILKRSFEWIKTKTDDVDGFCMFSYQYVFDPMTGERVEKSKTEVDGFLPVMQELYN